MSTSMSPQAKSCKSGPDGGGPTLTSEVAAEDWRQSPSSLKCIRPAVSCSAGNTPDTDSDDGEYDDRFEDCYSGAYETAIVPPPAPTVDGDSDGDCDNDGEDLSEFAKPAAAGQDQESTTTSSSRGKKRPAEDKLPVAGAATGDSPSGGGDGRCRVDLAAAKARILQATREKEREEANLEEYRRNFFSSTVSFLRKSLRQDKPEKRLLEGDSGCESSLMKDLESINAKSSELLQVLLHEATTPTSKEAPNIQDGPDTAALRGTASVLDACLAAARRQREQARHRETTIAGLKYTLIQEREELSRTQERSKSREQVLRKRLEEATHSGSEAERKLRLTQDEKSRTDVAIREERRKREDMENELLSLRAEVGVASKAAAALKVERDGAEARATMLQKNLKDAVLKVSSLTKTNEELDRSRERISQLEHELALARGTGNRDQIVAADSEVEWSEAETHDHFGLTQQVSFFSRKVDSEHGKDSKRVRDHMSEVRRLLEKTLNKFLKEKLFMSDLAIKDRSFDNMKKINMLRDKAGFPPDLIGAMHEMRRLGNDAIHDKDLPSRDKLTLAMKNFISVQARFESEWHAPLQGRWEPSIPRQVHWG